VPRTLRLLADTQFRRWYLARSISVAGTAATAVALPMLMYRQSGSAAQTAAITALEALPYLLFGLFAGAAADRLSRRRMMIGADLACAAMVSAVPVVYALGYLPSWLILAAAFGIGTGFCWFDAAAWGALARITGRERLPEANSLIWSTAVVLGIAVPAGAGLLAALTDPTVVLLGDAATYVVSALLIGRLSGLEAGAQPSGIFAGIADGLRYLWRTPVIRTLTLTGFCQSLSGGGVIALLVVHADQMLGVSATSSRIGLLYASAAAGGLAAALLLPALGRWIGQGPVSVVGYALFAVALCALAATHQYVAALTLWAVWQFAGSLAITNGITLRQQLTPDHLQGRVNTTGRMIAWGGTPFGALIGGAIAESAGVRAAYLTLVVPAALGIVALLASPVLRLRTAVETT